MGLSCGIVGLPNVGKSTLFNALSNAGAAVANYAFCTIEPNVGVVPIPDPRVDALVKLFSPEKIVPATIDFVDIAGLVRGASKGEGLGNQFLAHIRECDAIAHVVRCFEDENIQHVDNRIDPAGDVATITTELVLRDLATVQARAERSRKMLKANRPEDRVAIEICERLEKHLDTGQRALTLPMPEDEESRKIRREMWLLTDKPLFYVANVKEDQLANDGAGDRHVAALRAQAAAEGAEVVLISAAIEAEIQQLPTAEQADFLESVGLKEPGLHSVARMAYRLLDLITFFTAGKPEVHAWTIRRGTRAPQAAGRIHTDFEKGFIKAEVIWWEDLVTLGSEAACRSAGKMGIEGKDYVVRDGDVMHFRFSS